ncbi:MAG: DUF4142 domain-containing protein [Chitinophagaceae bacterium]|nr:DUF4142 domain-containing protein [Chitinophagaceae bacterium]
MRTEKIMMGTLGAFTSLLVLCSCGNEGNDSVAKADSINKAERRAADSLERADRPDEASSRFLVRAANSGMTEVMLSNVARDRSTRQPIKDIAQMLVADHQMVNGQVKTLAQQRNIALPDSISEDSKKTYDDVVAKRGTDFDKKYVNQMISNHEESINLFEGVLNDTNDAGVKTFAQNTLPKLREHLEKLKQIKDGIK